MPDHQSSYSGLVVILGGVVLLAFAIFLFTGGDLGGRKKVEGDADLPRVTSPAPRLPDTAGPGNVGTR